MEENIKWIAITDYVDVDTGEIISKNTYERDYKKIRTTKKIEITEKYNKKYGINKYITECERNRQQKLEL